jgi:hypothetical protein
MPGLSLYWRRRQRPLRIVARSVRNTLAAVSSPRTLISIHQHRHYTLRSRPVVIPPPSATAPVVRTNREVESVFRRITDRITFWRWVKARPLDAAHAPAAATPPPAVVMPLRGSFMSVPETTPSVAARAEHIADVVRLEHELVAMRRIVHREAPTWASSMRPPRIAPRNAAAKSLRQSTVAASRRVDRRGTPVVSRTPARMPSESPVQSPPRTSNGHRVIAFPARQRASATAQPSPREIRMALQIAWPSPRVRMLRTNTTTAPSVAVSAGGGAGHATAVALDWRRQQPAADRGRVDPPRASVPDRIAITPPRPAAAVATAPPPATPVGQTAPSAVLPFDRATLDRLAENVISRIERHIRIERERRGL